MRSIINARWMFLTVCLFFCMVFSRYVENDTHWLAYFAFMVMSLLFLIFSAVILVDVKKIQLTAKEKSNKFIIILFSLLFYLAVVIMPAILLYCVPYAPIPKNLLIIYRISFLGLCALMALPVVKLPSSSVGIATVNYSPVKSRWINMISLYSLNLLPREFQTDYVVRKMFNNEIINEQKFNVKAKFSPAFFERTKNAGKIININEIIYAIQVKAEDIIKKELFNKPIEMLKLSYDVEGEVTVTYLI